MEPAQEVFLFLLATQDHNMERAVEWLFNHQDDAMEDDGDASLAPTGGTEPVGGKP